MEKIISLETLLTIPVIEEDEFHTQMVAINKVCPTVLLAHEPVSNIVGLINDKMDLRLAVAQRLNQATLNLEKALPEAKFKVTYAYRHPVNQKRYYAQACTAIRVEHPNWDENQVRSAAHLLVAYPEVAGHPTGGAIDLTIRLGDHDLDMGTNIANFTDIELIRTFCTVISPTQRAHRMLLRELMMEQGFAPFDGEWWHFSYGDREWAGYYGKSHAIYGHVVPHSGCFRK